MNPQLLKEYRRVRDVQAQHVARDERDQHLAVYALRIARVRVAFRNAGNLVKLDLEPEIDAYDDSYVDTWTDVSEAKRAQIKKEIHKRLDHEGHWILVGYFRLSEDDPWESTDSVGGFIGDDWKDSGYDTDVMASALKALAEAQLRGRAERFEVREPVAEGWS